MRTLAGAKAVRETVKVVRVVNPGDTATVGEEEAVVEESEVLEELGELGEPVE